MDLFHLFRSGLVTVCTVYAIVRIAASLWRWSSYLAPARREAMVLQRYIVLQLLRLRPHRFAFDLVQITVLLGLLAYLVWLHRVLFVDG